MTVETTSDDEALSLRTNYSHTLSVALVMRSMNKTTRHYLHKLAGRANRKWKASVYFQGVHYHLGFYHGNP